MALAVQGWLTFECCTGSPLLGGRAPKELGVRVPAVYLKSAEAAFLAFLAVCRINTLRVLKGAG